MRKAEYRWGGHQGKFITMSIDISVPGYTNQSLSQGVLTLYEIKQLTMTELQWFTLNYAVRDAGIAWKRQLLPEHDDAARNMSQIIWKRRADAEERLAAVRMLFLFVLAPVASSLSKAFCLWVHLGM